MKKALFVVSAILVAFFVYRSFNPTEEVIANKTLTMEQFLSERGVTMYPGHDTEKKKTIYQSIVVRYGPPRKEWREKNEGTALWISGDPGEKISFFFSQPITSLSAVKQ